MDVFLGENSIARPDYWRVDASPAEFRRWSWQEKLPQSEPMMSQCQPQVSLWEFMEHPSNLAVKRYSPKNAKMSISGTIY